MTDWATTIVGQDVAVRTLDGLLDRDAPGRFILLQGPRGVGKRRTAEAAARFLLCASQPPCGECLACRSPLEHPDAVLFSPEKPGGSILIDAVREAARAAPFPPVSANARVWVFDAMEELTAGAANALLRLLEEPPQHLWVFGITHNPSAVPITLRSRAAKIPFALLSSEALQQITGQAASGGTVERAELLHDERFRKDAASWQELIAARWYNPDAVVKFARSAGGRGGNLQSFFVSLLLADHDRYNDSRLLEDAEALRAAVQEREALIQAISDLDANVNPAFVCESVVRTIRQIRKQVRRAS